MRKTPVPWVNLGSKISVSRQTFNRSRKIDFASLRSPRYPFAVSYGGLLARKQDVQLYLL